MAEQPESGGYQFPMEGQGCQGQEKQRAFGYNILGMTSMRDSQGLIYYFLGFQFMFWSQSSAGIICASNYLLQSASLIIPTKANYPNHRFNGCRTLIRVLTSNLTLLLIMRLIIADED